MINYEMLFSIFFEGLKLFSLQFKLGVKYEHILLKSMFPLAPILLLINTMVGGFHRLEIEEAAGQDFPIITLSI